MIESFKAKMAILPGAILGLIAGLNPLIWGLAAFQILDIVSGLMAAKGSWSSAVCSVGMNKKVMQWIYVVSAHLIKTISPVPIDFPVDALVAGYFVVVEVISMMENGKKLGVEAPPPLQKIVKIFTKFTVETDGDTETMKKTTTIVTAPVPAVETEGGK